MLKIEKLNFAYDDLKVLWDVDLEVHRGEIVTVVGANGAGKSTTLKNISRLVKPSSGTIIFDGKDLGKMQPHDVVGAGLVQVPEGRRIFPLLTVTENLAMGAFLRRDTGEIAKDREYIFSLFPILKERRHQPGGTLSGGEQQMLAISRALMARPSLLLLDEPSLGLAPLIAQLIFRIIRQVNEESGTTILLVEQNANMALKIAHRGYVMENGRITLEGSAQSLLNNAEVKRAYLGL